MLDISAFFTSFFTFLKLQREEMPCWLLPLASHHPITLATSGSRLRAHVLNILPIFDIYYQCGDIWSRDSSVGMATGSGLDDPDSIPGRASSDRFWGPPSLLFNDYRSLFPQG
jgi:hypothetical protein